MPDHPTPRRTALLAAVLGAVVVVVGAALVGATRLGGSAARETVRLAPAATIDEPDAVAASRPSEPPETSAGADEQRVAAEADASIPVEPAPAIPSLDTLQLLCRIELERGARVESWTVELLESGSAFRAPAWAASPPSAPSGRPLVVELPPGAWTLRAVAAGAAGPWRRVTLRARSAVPDDSAGPDDSAVWAPAAELVLPLAPATAVTGTVERADGGALDGFAVTALDERGRALRTTETDALGAFVIPSVPPGALRLVVGTPAAPLADPLALDVPPAGLDAGAIALPPLADVEVRVIDEAERPVAGARVRATAGLPRADDDAPTELRTDAFGRAVLRRRPPGELRVHAAHPEAGRGNAVIDVATTGASPVVVVLHAAVDPSAPPPRDR